MVCVEIRITAVFNPGWLYMMLNLYAQLNVQGITDNEKYQRILYKKIIIKIIASTYLLFPIHILQLCCLITNNVEIICNTLNYCQCIVFKGLHVAATHYHKSKLLADIRSVTPILTVHLTATFVYD